MKQSVLNIGHRGASRDYPENTIAAFRAAIEMGAQMCELDVQPTRDGAVVVIHDDTVDRTTNGKGAVAEMSLAELKRLDAGRGQQIPTLDEVFAATAGNCGLNIELKAGRVEREVADLMRKWNATATSMVSSFEWDKLDAIHGIDANIRIGVLAEKNPAAMLEKAAQLHAYAINPRFDLVTPALCEDAHAHGFKVLVWTVDVPELMRLLITHGVDGIMTNYPARLREVLGA